MRSNILTDMQNTKGMAMEKYIAGLIRSGGRVISGSAGTYWTNYEEGAMMRLPKFDMRPPSSEEMRQVFWQGKAAIASYLQEPDEYHPANAWLYICTDQEYSLEKLTPAMRRNVRRGLKELTIAPIRLDQLLSHGAQAFCDTRSRTGLSDGTVERFCQSMTLHSNLDTGVFLGAWKEDMLAAFLTITEVDDWIELGCYSANALLHYRPNDILMYSALYNYLVERKFRLVSYGLSSIQQESNAIGLHKFKIKVGFEACPVHRAFIPHPLFRPFVNHWSLWGIKTILRFIPKNRRLKKAGGVLEYMLGGTHMPVVVEEDAPNVFSS